MLLSDIYYLYTYMYDLFSTHLGRILTQFFFTCTVQCRKENMFNLWITMFHKHMCIPCVWLKLSEDTCYVALSLLRLSPQPAKQVNLNGKTSYNRQGTWHWLCSANFHFFETQMTNVIIVKNTVSSSVPKFTLNLESQTSKTNIRAYLNISSES